MAWSRFGRGVCEDIFVCNAADASLDGDECSDWEVEYFQKSEIPIEKSGTDFVVEDFGDDEVSISGNVIIIGKRGAWKDSEDNKFDRENKNEINRKRLIDEKKILEQKLLQIDKSLNVKR